MQGVPSLEISSGLVELPGRVQCASDDLDEFRAHVNSTFYPARIEPVGPDTRLTQPWLSAVQLRHLTLGIAHFGAEVVVDPGDVGGYHVNVPVSGTVASRCGSRQTVATPERAAVFGPNEHTILPSWDADAVQVCIKIERGALEAELAAILGRPVDRRVQFDIGFDVSRSAGRRWLYTLHMLLGTLNAAGSIPSRVLAAEIEPLERALILGLVINQGHSLTEALFSVVADDKPTAVNKVVELVHDEPGTHYTIAGLAQASGVGVRQLQKLFHDHFDMSPLEYLRNIRLDGVRSDILSGNEDSAVSNIAFRWGFSHLGRFAQHYRHKFGESPSQTRQR